MNTQKLTRKSVEAIQNAQSIAVSNSNQQIDTLHLLLSLLTQQDGLIPQLMKNMGIDEGAVAEQTEKAVSELPKVTGSGRRPDEVYITQETDRVLNCAEETAQRMGDEYVSVEHLFLGLIEKGKDKTKEILSAFNITKDKFLAVLKNVRGNTNVTSDNPENTYDVLKKYGQDLVELARNNKLDPVIGRDSEIRNVIRILSRKSKNNPVLIGEPGVGKTAIAEGLALRIVRGDVPNSLKDRQLFSLDMCALVAGSK